MSSVHIIGAGPVGISTGILIRLLSPQTPVRISERYREYQRQHLVRLLPESIEGMIQVPALRDLQKQLQGNCAIRTYDLENLLLNQARKLGIEILYEQISDPTQIRARFPTTRHIIAADGAHSLCRSQIFNNDLRFKTPLQYAIEVKYEVNQKAHRLPTDKVLALEEEFGSFRPIEYIGKFKGGVTPVTLWILVDYDTYKQMENATFKEPYNLRKHSQKIPPKLLTSIHNWLGARCEIFHEVRSIERITRLELTAYASRNVVKMDHGLHWSLVGDAALGVPFFRSLNNGMISSSLLARAIAADLLPESSLSLKQRLEKKLICWIWKILPSALKGSDESCSAYLKRYAIQQTWLAYKEYLKAALKSQVVRFLNFLLWLKCMLSNEWYKQMDLDPFNKPSSESALARVY